MLTVRRKGHAARRRAQPPRREQPVRPQAPELNRAIVARRRVPRLRWVLGESPQLHPLAARAAAPRRRAARRLRGLTLRVGPPSRVALREQRRRLGALAQQHA